MVANFMPLIAAMSFSHSACFAFAAKTSSSIPMQSLQLEFASQRI
jgi:hypothetical protein